MDYDTSDIASIYDEARAVTPERLRQWLDLPSAHIDRSTISLIDLGCGTGAVLRTIGGAFRSPDHRDRPIANDAVVRDSGHVCIRNSARG